MILVLQMDKMRLAMRSSSQECVVRVRLLRQQLPGPLHAGYLLVLGKTISFLFSSFST